MLNLPGDIKFFAGLLIAVHGIRWLLPQAFDVQVLLAFAFIPARYSAEFAAEVALPGGILADVWTVFTYALLHGDVFHLVFNLLWLLAFGSPIAMRFGTARFLAFSGICALAGALLHLISTYPDFVPMVGASAVISGYMAAAIRFVFAGGGPLGRLGAGNPQAVFVPAVSLRQALRDPRVLTFVGVWLALNLFFGLGSVNMTGESANIEWEAHLGGFLAGLLLFRLFDPVPPAGPTKPPSHLRPVD